MIAIIGAGGHGHVVADILELDGREYKFHDDYLPQYPHSSKAVGDCIIAIGNNKARVARFLALQHFRNAIHPSAIIAKSATLGVGIVVCAGAVINPHALIGNNVILNTGCIVEHDCVIEDHAHIAPGAVVCGGAFIGEGALVGANAVVVPSSRVYNWTLVKAGTIWK